MTVGETAVGDSITAVALSVGVADSLGNAAAAALGVPVGVIDALSDLVGDALLDAPEDSDSVGVKLLEAVLEMDFVIDSAGVADRDFELVLVDVTVAVGDLVGDRVTDGVRDGVEYFDDVTLADSLRDSDVDFVVEWLAVSEMVLLCDIVGVRLPDRVTEGVFVDEGVLDPAWRWR